MSQRNQASESWEENCLKKFNSDMGLPTKGFEKELLTLMKKMDGKRVKGNEKHTTRKTKFDMAMKNLE